MKIILQVAAGVVLGLVALSILTSPALWYSVGGFAAALMFAAPWLLLAAVAVAAVTYYVRMAKKTGSWL